MKNFATKSTNKWLRSIIWMDLLSHHLLKTTVTGPAHRIQSLVILLSCIDIVLWDLSWPAYIFSNSHTGKKKMKKRDSLKYKYPHILLKLKDISDFSASQKLSEIYLKREKRPGKLRYQYFQRHIKCMMVVILDKRFHLLTLNWPDVLIHERRMQGVWLYYSQLSYCGLWPASRWKFSWQYMDGGKWDNLCWMYLSLAWINSLENFRAFENYN